MEENASHGVHQNGITPYNNQNSLNPLGNNSLNLDFARNQDVGLQNGGKFVSLFLAEMLNKIKNQN